jgi:N-acetylmuramoyl-L-alanine amidase
MTVYRDASGKAVTLNVEPDGTATRTTTGNDGEPVPLGHQADGEYRIVQQGDSVSKLAFAARLSWQTAWNHEKNAPLRRARKDPNILNPGDVIWIPDMRKKDEEGCATERRHRFKRKGVPEKLNVQFLDIDRQPLGSKPYTLKIDGEERSGRLDNDGWLRVRIPPDAGCGHIKVGEHGEYADMDLNIGHLDPLETVTGAQGRLRNLGYYSGPIDGDDKGKELGAAILCFRQDHKMEESREIDDALRDKLRQRHGG